MLGLSSSPTLNDALNKLDQAIFSVAAGGSNYVYLSTGIGAFRLTPSLVAQGPSVIGTALTNGTVGGQSIMLKTQDDTLIGPVSAYSNNSSTAYGFAGTTKGLYGSSVAVASGIPSGGTLPLIAGTQGLNITSLATTATSYSGVVYTAAYSATTNEILILQNLSLTARIPALSGLPSGTLQLTWYPYSTHLVLVIAGSDATVEYPVF